MINNDEEDYRRGDNLSNQAEADTSLDDINQVIQNLDNNRNDILDDEVWET